MKKLVLFIISLFFLYSCTPKDYTYYDNYSDAEICVSYLTNAEYNLHQSSRLKQIESRNLDCTKYVDLARLKMEKEARDENIFGSSSQTICQKVGNTIVCNEY